VSLPGCAFAALMKPARSVACTLGPTASAKGCTAVLRAIRVYYDTAQQPIEIFDAAYHPTQYRYTATLFPRR
jgi:hypothetical protein